MLLAAVLRRAAYDIVLYRNSSRLAQRRIWMDAYKWMFSDVDGHLTSFLSVCTHLDQDPVKIRRLALTLRREDVKKLEKVDSVRL